MKARRYLGGLAVLFLVIGTARAEEWLQRYHDPQHTSFINASTEELQSINFDYIFDPRVPPTGDILIHYTDPLIKSNGEIITPYRECNGTCTITTIVYSVKKLGVDASEQWNFTSDFRGYPSSWTPVFGIGANNGLVYAAGACGSMWVLAETDGSFVSKLASYTLPDDISTCIGQIWTTSTPTINTDGTVYWTIRANPNAFGVKSAIVKAAPDGTITSANFEDLTGDVNQRAALNSAPAIAYDGTIFTVSTTAGQRNSRILKLDSDFNVIWNSSLVVNIGAGDPGGPCHEAIPNDNGTSSPVVLPDNSVVFGGWSAGPFCTPFPASECPSSEGFLYKFTPDGQFQACYQFGWDTTPGVTTIDGNTYLVEKHNHYTATPDFYELVVLDANTMQKVWTYLEPTRHEWCIDSPLLDRDGYAVVPSEGGTFYRIKLLSDPPEVTQVALTRPQSAAYVPNVGVGGKSYTINNGHLLGAGAAP